MGLSGSNIKFEFAGLFLNLYWDPCEGVPSLPPQTKNPRYGPGNPESFQICNRWLGTVFLLNG